VALEVLRLAFERLVNAGDSYTDAGSAWELTLELVPLVDLTT
jgi:hypothetical protein